MGGGYATWPDGATGGGPTGGICEDAGASGAAGVGGGTARLFGGTGGGPLGAGCDGGCPCGGFGVTMAPSSYKDE